MKSKRFHRRNYILPLFLIVTCSVLFLSVGYSTFSKNLLVDDFIASVRPDRDVRVTGNLFQSATNGGSVIDVDYSVSSIYSNLSLPNSNSSVTFSVSVKNYGNVEMGIKSISLPDELQNILDVSVSDYNVGSKIRDNDDSCESSANGCTLSINRTFNVTVKYKDGAYNSNNVNFSNFKLDFEFVEALKVTYTGFTAINPSADMNATSVLKGNDHSYNIGYHQSLTVKEGGVVLNTDRYSVDANNNLVVTDVNDHLEIIITEIMIPVKIEVKDPTTATIKYSVNSGIEKSVTGVLNTSVPRGSSLSIKVSASSDTIRYKSYSNTFTNIVSDVNEEITLDAECDVNITSSPSTATIKYSVDGGTEQTVTGKLTGTYTPGTKLKVTVSNSGYTQKTKEYTVSSHITETITLDKVCSVNISFNPNDAIIKYTINDGEEQTATGTLSGSYAPGTVIHVKASKSGYQPYSANYTIYNDFSETVNLFKYPSVKIAANPSDATIKYSVDGGAEQTVIGTLSGTYDLGTVIAVTVSKTGYETKTASYTVTSDLNETITLNKLVTYIVNSNVSSNIKLEYNGTSTSCNSATTCSMFLPEGSSMTYTVSANCYVTQGGSVSSTTTNITLNNKPIANPITIPIANASCSGCSLGTDLATDDSWSTSAPSHVFSGGDRHLTYNFTNFSSIPSNACVTRIVGTYRVNATYKPQVISTLSVNSSQCDFYNFTFDRSDATDYSIVCDKSEFDVSVLKSSTTSLKVLFRKGSGSLAGLGTGGWYGGKLEVYYIPA